MRKAVVTVVLTGLLLLGSGLVGRSTQSAACPMNCCHGPADCPTPACCARK